METIQITHPHQLENLPRLCLALGFFDGVHKGHQEVILTAKNEAKKRQLRSGVMTFFPHPKEVLRKEKKVYYLTLMKKKEALIRQLGIDYLFIVTFNETFAELNPQQFVDQYLIALNVKHVVAGFDYTYGRLGKGTMETLLFHSRNELTYTTVGQVSANGEKISSTNIRHFLQCGDLKRANDYLGRPYETSGTVIHGEKRGRTIGFPTANVLLEERSFTPNSGVYIVRLLVNNEWKEAVCNVGYKPTFHKLREGEPTIEVHVTNFNDDIYGETVTIQWLSKLRDEKKFNSIGELKAQLENDVNNMNEFFQRLC
ncbi:riboflavin biosynthesis protein RibF [Evansella cellulosilytica]|uniref:Riboflavin biosynthesis protein n=1 Tax=Evansella cellulosilytica (strain ATCC 21833 / DSM 2522 / FERM P-1141 / JCM 9156 / N-4) TaxID=649639 RepID=E6TS55_EVAC2|nr:riboflavin biosynthesis protein RibF [Evansella cellulosilytica]ADU30709.1 riboflavin biosynthesis protein RibF [Evansella cellulosilytica DSM 2522]